MALSREEIQNLLPRNYKKVIPIFWENPPIPECEPSIDIKRAQDWIELHEPGVSRNCALKIVQNIQFVSFAKFYQSLESCIERLNQAYINIEPKHVIVVIPHLLKSDTQAPVTHKSNPWIASMALPLFDFKPFAILDPISMGPFLMDNKDIKHIITFDDAAYSGTDMRAQIQDIRSHIQVDIVIPYMTNSAKSVLTTCRGKKAATNVYNVEIISTLNEYDFTEEEKSYLSSHPICGLKAKVELSRLTLTCFAHKLADSYSTPENLLRRGLPIEATVYIQQLDRDVQKRQFKALKSRFMPKIIPPYKKSSSSRCLRDFLSARADSSTSPSSTLSIHVDPTPQLSPAVQASLEFPKSGLSQLIREKYLTKGQLYHLNENILLCMNLMNFDLWIKPTSQRFHVSKLIAEIETQPNDWDLNQKIIYSFYTLLGYSSELLKKNPKLTELGIAYLEHNDPNSLHQLVTNPSIMNDYAQHPHLSAWALEKILEMNGTFRDYPNCILEAILFYNLAPITEQAILDEIICKIQQNESFISLLASHPNSTHKSTIYWANKYLTDDHIRLDYCLSQLKNAVSNAYQNYIDQVQNERTLSCNAGCMPNTSKGKPGWLGKYRAENLQSQVRDASNSPDCLNYIDTFIRGYFGDWFDYSFKTHLLLELSSCFRSESIGEMQHTQFTNSKELIASACSHWEMLKANISTFIPSKQAMMPQMR